MCCVSRGLYASTYITNTYIAKPVVWTKSRSPYILDGSVNIFGAGVLTVEAGTVVQVKKGNIFAADGAKVRFLGTASSSMQIQILDQISAPVIQGSKTDIKLEHVTISGFGRRFLAAWNYSEVHMNHVSYTGTKPSSGVWFDIFGYSKASVSNSSLVGWKGTGFEAFDGSEFVLRDSNIEYNQKGVAVFFNSSSTIAGNVFMQNEKAVEVDTANVTLSQNDFENNHIHINSIQFTVNAKDNWWGSVTTPKHVAESEELTDKDINTLIGPVEYMPISLKPHRSTKGCCSNVLFFPGLMGSRLYVKSLGLENQLWEPNRNADVKKLFLNTAGQSVLAGIYTKDIINRTNVAFGMPNIEESPYKGFSAFMDKLVKDKIITAWQSVPYDWRFAPDTLLDMNDVELQNTIVLLSQKSKTKKVTLISHSNGGLIIKQLMIRLKAVQLEHMIDKIIFVALPEYGTPQAVTSLLFGHEQSIANGLILKTSVAKELGKNMPTAYSLLPSDSFFNLSNSTIKILNENVVGGSTLRTFLTQYPHVNKELLNKSVALHNTLDTWVSPVPVFQIVGTGLPTVSGLQKVDGDEFVPTYTNTGDGTIPDMFKDGVFSRSGITAAVNLIQEKGIKHMTILNSVKVQRHVSSLIQGNIFDPSLSLLDAYDIRRLPVSYSIAKISASSSSGLLLKDSYDIYKESPLNNFDYIDETNNTNRYELLDTSVLYINSDGLEKFAISQQSNNQSVSSIDIDLFEREGDRLTQAQYNNVPINSTFTVGITGAILAVRINQNISIEIQPDVETSFDSSGGVVNRTLATTTRDRNKEAAEVRTQMIRGVISDALRHRYLTRLDAYAATGDLVYLNEVRTRIQRAIASISRFDGSPALKGRYAELKLDYQLLAYLFYYLTPDRPAHMRFVSP